LERIKGSNVDNTVHAYCLEERDSAYGRLVWLTIGVDVRAFQDFVVVAFPVQPFKGSFLGNPSIV